MTQQYHNIACTICGCVCDDISVRVDDGRIVGTERLCTLAEPVFEEISHGPASSASGAEVDGQAVGLAEAVARAAELLAGSRAPLVYGLSRSSTPGQRAAVRLADRLGGLIDTTASTCHAPSIMAVQAVGESTSTLGEVRNRSDLVIYWGSNPLESHPRHVERFVDAPGQFVPGGRADRTLVVVDTVRTETADLADLFIQVNPGEDFELCGALRMLVQGQTRSQETALGVGGPDARHRCPTEIAGVPVEQVERLCDLMKSCRYGAVFFGLGITRSGVPHANVQALLQMVTDLNDHTRFIARRMRIPGDVSGADGVLCWQTGFPFSVNLARGYPRYNPGEYTADSLLAAGEVDAAVLVGSEGVRELSVAAQQHLAAIPTIVLDYPGETCPCLAEPQAAKVKFTTAIYGIHAPGTAYRMDEVPIELTGFLATELPTDERVLLGILEQLPS